MRFFCNFSVLLCSIVFFFYSCDKDKKITNPPATENPPPVVPSDSLSSGEKGVLKVKFHNEVDGEPLVLDKDYTSPNGETFSVTMFDYYISNIVLTKNDNSVVVINEQYQIIRQSDEITRTITLSDIPVGSYKAMKLLLGVDSLRNTSGAQTGGLDVGYASDMYWTWSQGYIFMKLEGSSPASSTPEQHIAYHMGGAHGPYKTQREFLFNFENNPVNISTAKTPTVILSTNVNEVFKTPLTISFSEHPVVLTAGTKEARMIADNYSDMIQFEKIQY